MAVVLQQIGTHAGRLMPALNELDGAAWVAKGASETYVEQLRSCKEQARAVVDEATALSRTPEKLSGVLQLMFRMEALETMLLSVEQAARKYQSAEAAQTLAQLFAEGGADRERLRSYVVNLATQREHQFEVMDREAQRCRATLTAAPPPVPCKAPPTGRKK